MKKILLGLTILILISGCSSIVKDDGKVKSTKIAEIKTKLDNKETFVFTVGSDTCPACKPIEIVIQEFNNKDREVFYIDNSLEEKGTAKAFGDEYLDGSLSATPTTYFIAKGEVVKRLEGAISLEDFISTYNELIEVKGE